MDLLRFADDSALTPISELRQAAKRLTKTTGQKLSSAQDAVAQEMFHPRWDALVEASWTVHPPQSEGNPDPERHLVTRISNGRRLAISLMLPTGDEPDGQDISLAVHDWTEGGAAQRLLIVGLAPYWGRPLPLSEAERARLAEATTLQAQVRAIVPIVVAAADTIPRMIGKPRLRVTDYEDMHSEDLPEESGTVRLIAEVPGGKDRYEAEVRTRESRDALLSWLRTEETPGLYDFRVQKDGSLVARRAKFKTAESARDALWRAVNITGFLSWTGLEYPAGRHHEKAKWEFYRIGESDLFDHYDILRDRKSGATVVLNQPYQGHDEINRKGLLNLLNPGTVTAEAPPYASLHGLSRILFHSLEGQGADLEAIVDGAIAAARLVRKTDITLSGPRDSTAGKKATSRQKTSREFLSPVNGLQFDLSGISNLEKWALHDRLPSVEQLQTPYWRSKMKAFYDREMLSWDLHDQLQDGGLSLNDVVEGIRSCPLDADLWGFFEIFDFSEVAKAECYRRGVIAGEIYLGRNLFEREAGAFWAVLETRPYMRLMNLLYRSLVKMERPADALPIGRKMLELCPNDNIGVRYSIEAVEAAVGDPSLSSDLAEAFCDEDAEDD